MSAKTLQDRIDEAGSAVELLRNSQSGPYVYPVVPTEYSNWRDEQQAWQKSCILFNQSYHMMDMYLEGPDALKLLSDLGVNSFAKFEINQAKQFVPVNHDGYVIGDVVLFHLSENRFNLVGRPPTCNWVEYNLETGGYDAAVERDERAAAQQGPVKRKVYRYQVQGPNAPQVMEAATGAPMPDIRFFRMSEVTIGDCKVMALRHGMVGQPGWELFGPWQDRDTVHAALVEAGEEFGMRLSGSRTYSSNTLESGWIPSPMPAVYAGDRMKAFREWLPANGFEANASLGGSFYSDNIEDYYLTPHDLGYGNIVKYDHDFIGREALEAMPAERHRKKVTLVLNGDDMTAAIGNMYKDDGFTKYFDFPSAVYSTLPYDKVMKDGKTVGVSTWCGYSYNERKQLTLAMVEPEYAEPGTELTFVWGEENGGSNRPTVERHEQIEIRATVAPVPYADVARKSYRPK